MATVTVIGAGISGPTAALSLAQHGHSVTVYDQRTEHDLVSDGILGITPENVSALRELGADISPVELPNTFTEYDTKETRTSHFHYVTWTDLHHTLVNAARDNGVRFVFGQKLDVNGIDDITVRASGVGSASEVTTSIYTGYVVIRGLSTQFANTHWTTVRGSSDNSGLWLFNVGDTRDGASIEFFVRREKVTMRTTYSAVAPIETNDLPDEFQSIVKSVPIFQIAPLSDWKVPERMRTVKGFNTEFRIGDALGQMRPQTSMGANLGIREALTLPDMIPNDRRSYIHEFELLEQRDIQDARGRSAGIQRGKFGK